MATFTSVPVGSRSGWGANSTAALAGWKNNLNIPGQSASRPSWRENMAFKVPADIAKAAIAAGCTKCNITAQKLLVLGFLAGAYIAFGALLSEIVAGGLSNGTITDPDGGIWKIALPAGLIKFAAGKKDHNILK